MERQPYPAYKRCPYGDEEQDACPVEHNPIAGYSDHHYGCECEACVWWYRSLK